LDRITENGMTVDQTQLAKVAKCLDDQRTEALGKLKEGKFKAFFGLRNVTKKEMTTRRKILVQLLNEALKEIEELSGERPHFPMREDGNVSLMHHSWRPLMELHPFIKAWVETEYAKFMSQFVTNLPQKVLIR